YTFLGKLYLDSEVNPQRLQRFELAKERFDALRKESEPVERRYAAFQKVYQQMVNWQDPALRAAWKARVRKVRQSAPGSEVESSSLFSNLFARTISLIPLILIALVLSRSFVRIKADEVAAVFRAGKFIRVLGPGGRYMLLPFLDTYRVVNLKEKIPEWRGLSKKKLKERVKEIAGATENRSPQR
ncbi:MAG: hypothetical protein D3925_10730, partial [Candidatus Electrothrix sp. AR5]|nr:hypothetical protein [Candidatus Electrothrix sp. AR5]